MFKSIVLYLDFIFYPKWVASIYNADKRLNDESYFSCNNVFYVLIYKKNFKTSKPLFTKNLDVINMKKISVNFKNPSVTNGGKFQGWGTSLCWWANRVGYSPVLTEKSAKLFFSKDGLNLNIMRYNIGGGDDPAHKHITRTDSIVPGWFFYDKSTNEYTYNYTADINQLNILRAAYNSAENPYVELFSNSPPYFMTKSGCSSGSENPDEDN